jgi:hypothetical protein
VLCLEPYFPSCLDAALSVPLLAESARAPVARSESLAWQSPRRTCCGYRLPLKAGRRFPALRANERALSSDQRTGGPAARAARREPHAAKRLQAVRSGPTWRDRPDPGRAARPRRRRRRQHSLPPTEHVESDGLPCAWPRLPSPPRRRLRSQGVPRHPSRVRPPDPATVARALPGRMRHRTSCNVGPNRVCQRYGDSSPGSPPDGQTNRNQVRGKCRLGNADQPFAGSS